MDPDFTHLLLSHVGESQVVVPVAAHGQVVAVDNSVAVVEGGTCHESFSWQGSLAVSDTSPPLAPPGATTSPAGTYYAFSYPV